MTIVTGNQLAILVRTLDMLKHLTDKQGVLHVFELQALKELSRNFQTCAAQKSENGALSIVTWGLLLRTIDTRGHTLFIAWGTEEIEFWTGARKAT